MQTTRVKGLSGVKVYVSQPHYRPLGTVPLQVAKTPWIPTLLRGLPGVGSGDDLLQSLGEAGGKVAAFEAFDGGAVLSGGDAGLGLVIEMDEGAGCAVDIVSVD